MAVMSKLSNANAPSEGESHSVAGSSTSKYYFKVFMKCAVLIVGVAGTAWTVERAIGYAANNNTTEALLMKRQGKTSKSAAPKPKPKAGKTKGGGKDEKEDSSGPSVFARSEGDLALDDLTWHPPCSFDTDEECEASFCSGLQTVLKETSCPAEVEDCEVGVTCAPEVTTRKLSALETNKMIQRALISYMMPFFISFNIACAIPDCSDVTTEDVAELVAQTRSNFLQNTIDPQAFLDQLTAAIAEQNPAPEEFSFSFTLDPASSTISDAVTTSVPAGYEFLGEGACLSENSDGLYDYPSYIERDGSGYSITECATWCDNIAASACWVQNQAEKPYLGLSYENSGECYCHFSTSNSTETVDPEQICTLPDDSDSSSESGFGQIVFSECTADDLGYDNDCSEDFSCFKYIG